MMVEQGYESMVQYLLWSGATIDEPDGQGLTALHHAAKNGHAGPVTVLLEKSMTSYVLLLHEFMWVALQNRWSETFIWSMTSKEISATSFPFLTDAESAILLFKETSDSMKMNHLPWSVLLLSLRK